MTAKELRIGNRILFDGKITIVNTRMLAYINNANRLKNKIDLIAFEPIPLTEEILLKCGFKKILNQYKKTTKTKPFIILFLDHKFQYDDLRYETNLECIHQLQNLYFSLTEEELEINL